jgi:hypothetical protein
LAGRPFDSTARKATSFLQIQADPDFGGADAILAPAAAPELDNSNLELEAEFGAALADINQILATAMRDAQAGAEADRAADGPGEGGM